MKRGAERQATKDDGSDDDIEVIDPGRGLLKADDSVLAARPMRSLPKRASQGSFMSTSDSPSTNAVPPPLPFTFTPAASNATKSFASSLFSTSPSKATLNATFPFPPSSPPPSSTTSATATSSFPPFSAFPANPAPTTSSSSPAAADSPALKYYTSLRGLNHSLSSHVLSALSSDPFVDLSPVFSSYSEFREKIQTEFDGGRSERTETGTGEGQREKVEVKAVVKAPPAPPPSGGGFKGFSFPSSFPSSTSTTAAAAAAGGFTPKSSTSTTTTTTPSAFSFPKPAAAKHETLGEGEHEEEHDQLAAPPTSAFGANGNLRSVFATSPSSPFGAAPSPFFNTGGTGAETKTAGGKKQVSAFGLGPSNDALLAFGGVSKSGKEGEGGKEDREEEGKGGERLFGGFGSSTATATAAAAPTSAFGFGSPAVSVFGGSTGAVPFGAFGAAKPAPPSAGFVFGSHSPSPAPFAPPPSSTAAPFSSNAEREREGTAATEGTDASQGGASEGDGAEDGGASKMLNLGTNPHDEEGEGEEEEETVYKVRVKVYKLLPSSSSSSSPSAPEGTAAGGATTKKWADMGVGLLRLKLHPPSQRRRLLLRNSSSGKVVINFNLFPSLHPVHTAKSLQFVGHEHHAGEGEGVMFMVRFKTEEMARECEGVLGREVAEVARLKGVGV